MTDTELFAVFSHEYDESGMPVIELESESPMSEREIFNRHCVLNCITDPADIDREWAKWKASQKCG
jgi:hypothetical protein